MLSLFDRVSMERALNLLIDPKLRQLLHDRIANLLTAEFDLTDLSHFLVIEGDCTEADIIDEIGMSPLVNPIDGSRFGSDAFHPWWDWLRDEGGWFEMIVTVGGSGFAYVLFIQDSNGKLPELRALCRRYA